MQPWLCSGFCRDTGDTIALKINVQPFQNSCQLRLASVYRKPWTLVKHMHCRSSPVAYQHIKRLDCGVCCCCDQVALLDSVQIHPSDATQLTG